MSESMSLTIDQGLVKPIIDAKIKEAVLQSMGGGQKLIEGVVDQIMKMKVDRDGRPSSYSSDKPYIDWIMTELINSQIKLAFKEYMEENASDLKAAFIRILKSKKGSNNVADAILAGMSKRLESDYAWHIEAKFNLLDR